MLSRKKKKKKNNMDTIQIRHRIPRCSKNNCSTKKKRDKTTPEKNTEKNLCQKIPLEMFTSDVEGCILVPGVPQDAAQLLPASPALAPQCQPCRKWVRPGQRLSGLRWETDCQISPWWWSTSSESSEGQPGMAMPGQAVSQLGGNRNRSPGGAQH